MMFGSIVNYTFVVPAISALFIGLFFSGIFSVKNYKEGIGLYVPNNAELILLLCYLFITLGVPMLISMRKPVYVSYRYSIAAWPAFPLILGLGVSKIKSSYTLVITLAFILFISSASLYWHHFLWLTIHDNRSVASFVEANATDGDVIVSVPLYLSAPIKYYVSTPLEHLGYPGPSIPEIHEDSEKAKFPRTSGDIRTFGDMVELARAKVDGSTARIFFVYSPEWTPNVRALIELFDGNFRRLESVRYKGVGIIIYSDYVHS